MKKIEDFTNDVIDLEKSTEIHGCDTGCFMTEYDATIAGNGDDMITTFDDGGNETGWYIEYF